MVETIDTPDIALMVENINYNLNLFMFLIQFLLGVAYVIFICYALYKLFDWYSML